MIARKHGVPVVERKSLAQALYKTVKIDQEIPLALYYVVAELMTYVYHLKGGPPPEAKR
jgi:flagellar biosynthetic protein FlhB